MGVKIAKIVFICLPTLLFYGLFPGGNITGDSERDHKVSSFLDLKKDQWHDLNVPEADGKKLFELIVANGYTRALEIGTSTGHSGIWIAWALSKTGGKLITIEIDRERHLEAVKNFKEAGLSDFVEARLADAHTMVDTLTGPFDFIFSDADKDWYTRYFIALFPKLTVGGCFTAHNVTGSGWGMSGTTKFYAYIKAHPQMETSLFSEGSGLSISYKKKPENTDEADR